VRIYKAATKTQQAIIASVVILLNAVGLALFPHHLSATILILAVSLLGIALNILRFGIHAFDIMWDERERASILVALFGILLDIPIRAHSRSWPSSHHGILHLKMLACAAVGVDCMRWRLA
jgi:hypothetical protein